jgi:hypothetical protein
LAGGGRALGIISGPRGIVARKRFVTFNLVCLGCVLPSDSIGSAFAIWDGWRGGSTALVTLMS